MLRLGEWSVKFRSEHGNENGNWAEFPAHFELTNILKPIFANWNFIHRNRKLSFFQFEFWKILKIDFFATQVWQNLNFEKFWNVVKTLKNYFNSSKIVCLLQNWTWSVQNLSVPCPAFLRHLVWVSGLKFN